MTSVVHILWLHIWAARSILQMDDSLDEFLTRDEAKTLQKGENVPPQIFYLTAAVHKNIKEIV